MLTRIQLIHDHACVERRVRQSAVYRQNELDGHWRLSVIAPPIESLARAHRSTAGDRPRSRNQRIRSAASSAPAPPETPLVGFTTAALEHPSANRSSVAFGNDSQNRDEEHTERSRSDYRDVPSPRAGSGSASAQEKYRSDSQTEITSSPAEHDGAHDQKDEQGDPGAEVERHSTRVPRGLGHRS